MPPPPSLRPPLALVGASRAARRRAWRASYRSQRLRYRRRDGARGDLRPGFSRPSNVPRGRVFLDLTPCQTEVFDHRARHRVLIAGRRSGKTHLACIELFLAAVESPGSVCWYVAPTYRMAKDIAWELLKALIPPEFIVGKPNESALSIRLTTGSLIALKGAENYRRLKGRTLRFVVLDEFAQMDELVWTEAIRPSLSTTQGRALFISTPLGFNWAYDLYISCPPLGTRAGWHAWQITTARAGLVSPEELAEARAETDPRIYRQEYEASFETLHGRVYTSFLRAANVTERAEDPGAGAVLVGMDFNINPMTAVLAVKRQVNGRAELHIFDALQVMTSNTDEVAQLIRHRYERDDPERPGVKRLARDVFICPDPSGQSGSTKAPVGVTDHTILRRYGFELLVDAQAPRVVDRVNAVNAALCTADGTRRVFIHPRAAPLIKALDGLTYKEGANVPDPKSPLIHITDALGYLIWQQFNLLASARWTTGKFAA